MKPKKNYDKLKVTKEVDSYEAWDSDVARGSLHALLNPPHDPNKKRPPLGWEDEDSRKPSLNNENRSDNQDGFSMPKFSARTNGESRVGNFRRMMDALKSGVKPSPRVEVHDGRREVTADISVSQVKRFMKDKRLTDYAESLDSPAGCAE